MTSRRVHHIFNDLVPCRFAKVRPGELVGYHTITTGLSSEFELRFIKTECEGKHEVQLYHELTGQADTCFAFKEHALRDLREKDNVPAPLSKNEIPGLDYLYAHFDRQLAKREQRFNLKCWEDYDYLSPMTKRDMLCKRTNIVAAKLLQMPVQTEPGLLGETRYPKAFSLYTINGKTFGLEFLSGQIVVASFDTTSGWDVKEDQIKAWASSHWTPYIDLWPKKPEQRCDFCKAEYGKIYRHAEGPAHADRVVSFVKLVTRAISSEGLRALNQNRFANKEKV